MHRSLRLLRCALAGCHVGKRCFEQSPATRQYLDPAEPVLTAFLCQVRSRGRLHPACKPQYMHAAALAAVTLYKLCIAGADVVTTLAVGVWCCIRPTI